jgi:hypothetical protein
MRAFTGEWREGRTRALVLAVLACMAGGCVRETRTRAGGIELLHDVPLVRAPSPDRCAAHVGTRRGACAEGRTLGQVYVRRLAVGDEVCLEGGFGDPPQRACAARAAVADAAVNRVLIEVREARPGSPWFSAEQRQFWFEEGALVDLYLKDHGY